MGEAKDEWGAHPSASGGHSADAGEIEKVTYRICGGRGCEVRCLGGEV